MPTFVDRVDDLSESGRGQLCSRFIKLRRIEEINEFIICLDNGSTEELEQRKFRLRKIYELLATKEEEDRVLRSGALAFLRKPVGKDALLRVIRMALENAN